MKRSVDRVRNWGLLLALLASPAWSQPQVPVGSSERGAEIVGSATPREDGLAYFAVLFDGRVRDTMNAYSPAVAGTPARWVSPATFVWDFGDGSPPVTVEERVSVSHRYEDQGTYTITVRISDEAGEYLIGEREIEVTNKDPRRLKMAAVKGDGAGRMLFTASAQDTPADTLTYSWDFGDGETREGIDLWSVAHQYVVSGEFEVSLTVTDEDGGEATKTIDVVVSGSEATDVEWDPLDPDAEVEAVISGMKAAVNGALSAELEAEVRSMAGVHLSRIDSGACRFTFTTWDNSLLSQGLFVLDFPVIPPEGATYRFAGAVATLVFHHRTDAYVGQRSRYAGTWNGEDPMTKPLAGSSPFGLEEEVRFQALGGTADVELLPGAHLKGEYNLVLDSKSDDWGSISFNGEFAIDLAQPRGLAVYDGCHEGPPIEITSRYPDPDSEHVSARRPPVRVSFDQKIKPDSIDEATFQVGYPNPEGEFVPADGRIVRGERSSWFVPDEPLKAGVRYSVRVKGGDNGLESIAGSKLPETNDDDWHLWHFTTALDFATRADGSELLACHMFQTVRDAPLVAGKPALARLYANWSAPDDVAEEAQVREFDSRIVLNAGGVELGSARYRFVRPDLWGSRGLDKTKAQHTGIAWIDEVPEHLPHGIFASVRVPTEAGGEFQPRYASRCPVELWNRKPSLTIDLFALRATEWADDARYQAMLGVFGELRERIETYAWQLFPIADVQISSEIRSVVPINRDGFVTLVAEITGLMSPEQAAASYVQDVVQTMQERSDADVALLLVPHGLLTNGGMIHPLSSGQAIVYSMVGEQQANLPKYVNAAVHEIGHALSLDHVPYVTDAVQRARLTATRESGADLWYLGTEGYRMKREGGEGWNKSSTEGNEQASWLTPLMFPGTIAVDRAFIAGHQYRQVQDMWP